MGGGLLEQEAYWSIYYMVSACVYMYKLYLYKRIRGLLPIKSQKVLMVYKSLNDLTPEYLRV